MKYVVHPKTFTINGYIMQILALCHLSDEQAGNIAAQFYRKNKLKKKDKAKIIQVVTTVDEQSARMYGN